MRAVLAAAGLALIASGAFAGAAQAAPWIVGDWWGVYECGEEKIPLKMEFFADNRGAFFGGFAYRRGDDYLSLRLHGTFSETGVLRFEPRSWIIRPKGVQWVGFTAQAYNRAAEGQKDMLVGEAPFPGCGKFTVERR